MDRHSIKRRRQMIFLDRTREGRRQSDEHWNSFKGTLVKRLRDGGWRGYGLFRTHRYHLGLNWETESSAYGPFRVHRYHHELNWSDHQESTNRGSVSSPQKKFLTGKLSRERGSCRWLCVRWLTRLLYRHPVTDWASRRIGSSGQNWRRVSRVAVEGPCVCLCHYQQSDCWSPARRNRKRNARRVNVRVSPPFFHLHSSSAHHIAYKAFLNGFQKIWCLPYSFFGCAFGNQSNGGFLFVCLFVLVLFVHKWENSWWWFLPRKLCTLYQTESTSHKWKSWVTVQKYTSYNGPANQRVKG